MKPNPKISLPADIPSPSAVAKWVAFYNSDQSYQKYHSQEVAVRDVFTNHSSNSKIEDILIKTAVLNTYYNTGIQDAATVAEHILNLPDIDARIEAGNPTVVNDIAAVVVGGKKRDFYSFATKYCFHHNQNYFIFDSFVEKCLRYFQEYDARFKTCVKYTIGGKTTTKFTQNDLRDYSKFSQIYKNFINCYGLTGCSNRDIDHYLWVYGKSVF